MHFLYMYIAFDLQFEHISNYYEFYLLMTQQEHHNENASSSTVTESYTEDNERVDDSGDELSDRDIEINEGRGIRFANEKEIKQDHRLFDERRSEKEYTWLHYNCNKGGYMCKVCEVCYGQSNAKAGWNRGAWFHVEVRFKDNPGKKLKRHDDSESHKEEVVTITNLKIDRALNKTDQHTRYEKRQANELYIEKLLRIIHFLARNNLAVKELYPKVTSFLTNELHEPIIKQYLEKCPKNAAYDSSDSCDALLNSLNLHLKEKSIRTLMEADDIAIFGDEATSLARKETMGLLSAYDEKNKRVVVEFVSIATLSSTQSTILMNKVRNILSDSNIDISKTRFSCLDGANAMSETMSGLQRRIRHFAPFPIYVNCQCHRLALCFKHLFERFPWLESLDKMTF